MYPRILLLNCLALFILSCKENDNRKPGPSNQQEHILWVDETNNYLPKTSEWTNRVEVADINNDGLVDLLFANGGNYSEPGDLEPARIFLNQGINQVFKEVTQDILGESKFISRVIKVRDINNDDIPDIIIGNTYQSQTEIFVGKGNGEFRNETFARFPQINASIGDLELGDVDFDGDLDIILADWGPGNNMNNNGGRTMLWLNDGNGVFQDVTSTQMPDVLIQFSWDLEFFDFDNDTDLDVAISCKRCGTSRIYVNDGSGTFEDKRMLPAYTNNYDFEAMDVNNDGWLDLVTINDGEIVNGDSYSRREHIFINEDGKRFRDATHELWPDESNIGEDDNNIAFLDYDSDGDPDFLVSSLTGEDRLLVNNGEGQFQLIEKVMEGKPTPLTLSLVLADVNGDHSLDILMGQGEGEEGIEERIFIGNDILKDTARPIISNVLMINSKEDRKLIVRARIHDHKTPNMPHDWEYVTLVNKQTNQKINMSWYGENLWYGMLDSINEIRDFELCAMDKAGNENCFDLRNQN